MVVTMVVTMVVSMVVSMVGHYGVRRSLRDHERAERTKTHLSLTKLIIGMSPRQRHHGNDICSAVSWR